MITPTHTLPSYLDPQHLGPWGIYLEQIDRVTPYLGSLSRWVETLKRPKRMLIVDVPIELDNGISQSVVCDNTQTSWFASASR